MPSEETQDTAHFWLDGGYDRDQVEACRLHPNHGWITVPITAYGGKDEQMTVCRVCAVPRCGESELDGCDLPRHHPEPHRAPSGQTWPIGGTRKFDSTYV